MGRGLRRHYVARPIWLRGSMVRRGRLAYRASSGAGARAITARRDSNYLHGGVRAELALRMEASDGPERDEVESS